VSTIYHQLLKTKPAKITFEPAEQDRDLDNEEPPKPPKATVQPPKAVIQFLTAMVQPPKASALPGAIDPIDDSDDDLTPPPETPPPDTPPADTPPRMLIRSGRNAAIVSIAMMIEQGPETYRAALDADDAEQWKEAIGTEVASMESDKVFTFIEQVPEGASMIGSHWVMGRMLMAYATIDKWKVRLVGRGVVQKPGD